MSSSHLFLGLPIDLLVQHMPESQNKLHSLKVFMFFRHIGPRSASMKNCPEAVTFLSRGGHWESVVTARMV